MKKFKDQQFNPEMHINMWKHYDTLRQSKNGYFLTANSILVAIVGLLSNELNELNILVSILGILVCTSWILLLNRNSEYIKYHRKKASINAKELWKIKKGKSRSSKYYDRVPIIAFLFFWLGVLVIISYRLLN